MLDVVVLLSGGMDSAVCLGVACSMSVENITTLTFDYGQRNVKEMNAARSLAAHYKADYKQVTIDFGAIRGSPIVDPEMAMPDAEQHGSGISPTYVPARNTIFLSHALALAESVGADEIYIGANLADYTGYPDCRPEFYEAFQEVVWLGTKRGVEGGEIEILTPLIRMSKADIVRKGEELGVPWALTWSCYRGYAKACGACAACKLRLEGFREAGMVDPIEYL